MASRDPVELSDPRVLKAVSHPARWRVLEELYAGNGAVTSLQERWRADLLDARRNRDAVRVAVLRGVLAAVANAEAVPQQPDGTAGPMGVVGVGAAEAPRRVLTDDETREIARGECADRERAADLVADRSPDRAERLRAERAVLAAYL